MESTTDGERAQGPTAAELVKLAAEAQRDLMLVYGVLQRFEGLGRDDTSPEAIVAALKAAAGHDFGFNPLFADDALRRVADKLDDLYEHAAALIRVPQAQVAWNVARAGGAMFLAAPMPERRAA